MFSLLQIEEAHNKVKSGADFPNYIKELIKLGVQSFTTYVSDGHTDYNGQNDFILSSDAIYQPKEIHKIYQKDQFIFSLRIHQEGKTDFITFCNDCAINGVNSWKVDLRKMTCTYYDLASNEVIVEKIPQ